MKELAIKKAFILFVIGISLWACYQAYNVWDHHNQYRVIYDGRTPVYVLDTERGTVKKLDISKTLYDYSGVATDTK
jgi:hypothetical protein